MFDIKRNIILWVIVLSARKKDIVEDLIFPGEMEINQGKVRQTKPN